MNWKDRKVLVTGAGGFIGSYLVERLVHLGANVRAFVRYNSRNDQGLIELFPSSIKDKLEIIMGDLRDAGAIRTCMRDIDVLFHLGAVISIPYSYIHPREVVETNVIGTFNVLNTAKEFEVKRIVHTSTSEVYGTARRIPIDEDHPLQGQSPYSASKIGADKLAESFYRTFDLPIAVIRPFNTYGPKQSARAVIPTIITQALIQEKVFLGSLHPKRDFTYVDDTVEGFLKVAKSDQTIGEVINIGSGFEISVGDIAKRIISLIGREIEIVVDPKRIRPQKSEVEELIADNRKAKKMLEWEPHISIDEGLSKTIAWIKENIERYKADIYNV